MRAYLHTRFEASSMVPTSFSFSNFTPPPPPHPPPQNEPLKSSPRLGLIEAESDKVAMLLKIVKTKYQIFLQQLQQITSTFTQQYILTKASRYFKRSLKKLKSFIAKDKTDSANENDSENSIKPETSGSESSISEARTI